LFLSPAYILRYAITLWAVEHNVEYIHHGGGRNVSESDSLYCFKKQFGQNTLFDFYIAEKVWDKEMYDRLKEIMKPEENVNQYIQRKNREIVTMDVKPFKNFGGGILQ
jgi:hypothetical protein